VFFRAISQAIVPAAPLVERETGVRPDAVQWLPDRPEPPLEPVLVEVEVEVDDVVVPVAVGVVPVAVVVEAVVAVPVSGDGVEPVGLIVTV
jgi:hypothetical protein